MKILRSILCGFASVIGAFAVFAGIVWLYSGFMLGFSSDMRYDARVMVDDFPLVSITIVAALFTLGFSWQYRR